MVKKLLCFIIMFGLFLSPFANQQIETEQEKDDLLNESLRTVISLTIGKTAREILADPEAVESVTSYGEGRLHDQCQRQPETPWCPKGDEVSKTKLLPASQIKSISQTTYVNFIYTRDVEDTWNSNLALVNGGLQWHGDCDDLTSTTIHAIHNDGQKLSKLWMLLVNSSGPGLLDHVVGLAMDEDGELWVVGDTSSTRNVYPLSTMTHRPMAVARMDKPFKWVPVTKSPLFAKFSDLVGAPETEENQDNR